jgi:hypothetical protein
MRAWVHQIISRHRQQEVTTTDYKNCRKARQSVIRLVVWLAYASRLRCYPAGEAADRTEPDAGADDPGAAPKRTTHVLSCLPKA